MSFRLELAKPRSPNWPWALRMIKSARGHYSVFTEDKLEIHVFESDDPEDFWPVFEVVRVWRQVAVYIDGRLLPRSEAHFLLAERVIAKGRDIERTRKADIIIDEANANARARAQRDELRRRSFYDLPGDDPTT